MAPQSFPELIGQIVHNCGAIEHTTNLLIQCIASDRVLSNEIIRLNFGRRVNILRELMLNRTPFSRDEIESLCDELRRVAKERNMIAHNPIQPDNRIIVIRSVFDESVKELNQGDVEEVLERALHAVKRLREIAVKLGYLPTE